MLWPDTFSNAFHPSCRGRRSRVLEDAGFEVRVPHAARLLRPDLDLDRPARHRAPGAAPHAAGAARRHPRRRPGRRAGAVLHRRVPLGRARAARRRRGHAPAVASRPAPWPSCSPNGAPTGSRRSSTSTPSSRPTATSTPCSGSDADDALMTAGRRSTPTGSASGCCGLAGNFGFEARPLRGVAGRRRTGPAAPRPRRRRRAPSCSPTGSAAAPRSSRATPVAPPSTSPSCSPPACDGRQLGDRPERVDRRRDRADLPGHAHTTGGTHEPDRRRLRPAAAARVGRRAGLRLRRRRHQRPARRLADAPTTSRASSRPGTRRWPPSKPCGYAKFSGRVGVCTATSGPGAIHLLNGLYDAKLDHVAGRRHRRPDRPLRDGRRLPAGGRPAQPVQGRRRPVLPDGHRARAAAQRPRPGAADRLQPAHRDRGHHPLRRAGAGVHAARARVQDGALQPRPDLGRPGPGRRRPAARRRRAQRRREGRGAGRPGRPRRPPRRSPASPSSSAPASPRRCSARTCSPTSCRG